MCSAWDLDIGAAMLLFVLAAIGQVWDTQRSVRCGVTFTSSCAAITQPYNHNTNCICRNISCCCAIPCSSLTVLLTSQLVPYQPTSNEQTSTSLNSVSVSSTVAKPAVLLKLCMQSHPHKAGSGILVDTLCVMLGHGIVVVSPTLTIA